MSSVLREAANAQRAFATEIQYYTREATGLAGGDGLRLDLGRLGSFQEELRALHGRCDGWVESVTRLKNSRRSDSAAYREAVSLLEALSSQGESMQRLRAFFEQTASASLLVESQAARRSAALASAPVFAVVGARAGAAPVVPAGAGSVVVTATNYASAGGVPVAAEAASIRVVSDMFGTKLQLYSDEQLDALRERALEELERFYIDQFGRTTWETFIRPQLAENVVVSDAGVVYCKQMEGLETLKTCFIYYDADGVIQTGTQYADLFPELLEGLRRAKIVQFGAHLPDTFALDGIDYLNIGKLRQMMEKDLDELTEADYASWCAMLSLAVEQMEAGNPALLEDFVSYSYVSKPVKVVREMYSPGLKGYYYQLGSTTYYEHRLGDAFLLFATAFSQDMDLLMAQYPFGTLDAPSMSSHQNENEEELKKLFSMLQAESIFKGLMASAPVVYSDRPLENFSGNAYTQYWSKLVSIETIAAGAYDRVHDYRVTVNPAVFRFDLRPHSGGRYDYVWPADEYKDKGDISFAVFGMLHSMQNQLSFAQDAYAVSQRKNVVTEGVNTAMDAMGAFLLGVSADKLGEALKIAAPGGSLVAMGIKGVVDANVAVREAREFNLMLDAIQKYNEDGRFFEAFQVTGQVIDWGAANFTIDRMYVDTQTLEYLLHQVKGSYGESFSLSRDQVLAILDGTLEIDEHVGGQIEMYMAFYRTDGKPCVTAWTALRDRIIVHNDTADSDSYINLDDWSMDKILDAATIHGLGVE